MSATQFYVSGPTYTWVGLGSSNAWLFLGYTETGMTVAITPLNEDIQVDYAGAMPGDVSQLGLTVSCSGTFTRYDEQVLLRIMNMLGTAATQAAGSYGTNQVGTLMNLEGAAYPLLLYAPYSFKSEFSTMVPGFAFNAAYVDNNLSQTLSIRRKAPEIGWRCIPQFGTFSGSVFNNNTAPFNAAQIFTNVMPNPLPNTD